MTLRNRFVDGSLLLLAAGLLACNSEDTVAPEGEGSGDGVFESAAPGASSDGRSVDLAGDAAAATPPGAPESSNDAASRAIAEADIIQTEGNVLYALSQYGGLSTIDVSDVDNLRLLGRHKVVATPFEMYVREGVVFALYQGYGEYIYDEDSQTTTFAQTSNVVVIDTRDPSSPTTLATFPVSGSISDSRIVGDVLYVVSFEDGYCWGCQLDAPRTTVTSLDVSDPAAVVAVDELAFAERTDSSFSWRRSISVNDQRMYVAGPEWGPERPIGSTIQVVDISDPQGDLVLGDSVQVAGQINSRWQMDEYQGVLRVISQPFDWALDTPPSVETFTVASSAELAPLGATTLVLPRPEQLQSARFDGNRGYAITFERTDPLFTLDLTDPAQPRQVGALEMPGFVYHMEPRGDRLLGLGFDNTSDVGSLHVSLFDVSDMANPVQLARANFGGDWGWLPEDQDRVQKAFNLLDAQGLILMPFSGYQTSFEESACGYNTWQSGVQLIDWAGDTLEARGVATSRGQARRGFLLQERLVSVSDERVEVFNIADRDAPESTSQLALAHNVSRTVGADGKVVRIAQNWYTNSAEVDVTTVSQAGVPSATGTIEVASFGDVSACYGGSYLSDAVMSGDRAHLVYQTYDYDPSTGKSSQATGIATLDVSDVAAPVLLGSDTLDFAPGFSNFDYRVVQSGLPLVVVNSALAFNRADYSYDEVGQTVAGQTGVELVDVSDPGAVASQFVELPGGLGTTALLHSADIVARSHYEASPNDPTRVRFYLDRVDASEPSNPRVLPTINIPGSLLAFDAPSGHAITVDYRAQVETGITAQDCYENQPLATFQAPGDSVDYATTEGTCTLTLQSLKLVSLEDDRAVVLGTLDLGEDERISAAAVGDDRVFVQLGGSGYFGGGIAIGGIAVADVAIADCAGFCGGFYGPFASQPQTVITVGGLRSGRFATGRLELEGGDYFSYTPIAAAGERAVLSVGYRGRLLVIDGSDVSAPTVLREVETTGYVQHLSIVDGTAVAAMGFDGVTTISLAE